MAPTIRIDHEVWEHMKKHARPLEDNPNTVLRRLLGLSAPDAGEKAGITIPPLPVRTGPGRRGTREEKTPQRAYRGPILKILYKMGGRGEREVVLHQVEQMMTRDFTPHDRKDIETGGMARWQKTAEFEVHAMRRAGLIRPVSESRHGEWELTPTGKKAAQE